MSLKKQTVSGVKWITVSGFVSRLIFTASTAVLARLLQPSTFGLYALAFVAIDALSMFKSIGFDTALIRRKDDLDKALNTAFFLIPIFGILLFIILFTLSPLIGQFFNNKELVNVLRVLGIVFIFSCFAKVPAALLEKRMQFAKISFSNIISILVYCVSAILFALLNFGIWSLVFAYILRSLVHSILVWYFSKWKPSRQFDRKIALEMFHFGKYVFLTALLWFLKSNFDNLMVGKLLGVTALGLYAIAFRLANFVADFVGGKLQHVIFPAFSQIQLNRNDLKKAFLKITKYLGIFAFPFCAIIFLFGVELLKVIYGDKWLAAAPALKVLAFAGLLNTLPMAFGSLFYACGKSKTSFWFSFIQVALFFVFITPAALSYGLVGTAMVVALSQLIAIIVFLPFTMRLISLKFKDIYLCLKPGLVSGVTLSFSILLYKNILEKINISTLNHFLTISILLIFLSFIYLFTIWLIDSSVLKELKNMMIKA